MHHTITDTTPHITSHTLHHTSHTPHHTSHTKPYITSHTPHHNPEQNLTIDNAQDSDRRLCNVGCYDNLPSPLWCSAESLELQTDINTALYQGWDSGNSLTLPQWTTHLVLWGQGTVKGEGPQAELAPYRSSLIPAGGLCEVTV